MKLDIQWKVGLSLFALLICVLGNFIAIQVWIHGSRSYGRVINLAGNQRMLTQRITKETLFVVNGLDVREDTLQTEALFEQTIHGLINGDQKLGLPPAGTEEIKTQLQKVEGLWDELRQGIARALNGGLGDSEAKKELYFQSLHVLEEMNKAVIMMEADASKAIIQLKNTALFSLLFSLVVAAVSFIYVRKSILRRLYRILSAVNRFSEGEWTTRTEVEGEDEISDLMQGMNRMAARLQESNEEIKRKDWIKSGQNELAGEMRGDLDMTVLADNIIKFLAEYLDANMGALYLRFEESSSLNLAGSYAFSKYIDYKDGVRIKDGLLGEAAHTKKRITMNDIPEDYVRIRSATVDSLPKSLVITPIVYEGESIGVIELASFREFSETGLEFLDSVIESIAISINSAQSNARMAGFFEGAE